MLAYIDFTELNVLGEYLVKILSAVLHRECVPDKPDHVSWDKVYELAKMHGVESMAYYGVKSYIKEFPEVSEKWKRSRDQNLIQSMTQKAEQNLLFMKLSEKGIAFIPLKGCELKGVYEQEELRQMFDLDLLIKPQYASKVRNIMEELGYTTEEYGVQHHDEYFKAPYVTVEIHRQMRPEDDSTNFYFQDIWKKTVCDSDLPECYHLKPEDFYIHLVIHFAMHFLTRGSGIRSLMDIYVYLCAFGNILDREYIRKELKKLKLSSFCEEMENLSFLWFGKNKEKKSTLTKKKVKELEREIFASGLYGTWESMSMQRMKDTTETYGWIQSVRYAWKRVFMSRKEMAHSYPVLKKHSVLLPFYWIIRALHIIFYKRDSVKKEVDFYKKRKGLE